MFPITETTSHTVKQSRDSKETAPVQGVDFSLWNSDNTINCDGVIDNYKQGNTGDCWLLEGLEAMANTTEGAEYIKDSIKKNFFGGVTVTLKGVDKSYIVMPWDLKDAKHLSSGDDDVKVIEIAVERYRREQIIEKMKLQNNSKGGFSGLDDYKKLFKIKTGDGTLDDPLNGGSLGELMYLMTGRKTVEIHSCTRKNIKSLSEIKNPKDAPMVISFKKNVNSSLVAEHAYAVISSDEAYTTLVNPWDSSKKITVATSLVLENYDKAEYVNLRDDSLDSSEYEPKFL